MIDSEAKAAREQTWKMEVPDDAAATWNCKYRVRVDTTFATAQKASNSDKEGFVVVQVEAYGFDEDVNIISQPTDAKSLKGDSTTSDENLVDLVSNTVNKENPSAVRVYKAEFSQKFFFPASNDVLVEYAPIRNRPGPQQNAKAYQGRFRLRAWYQNELTLNDKLNSKTVADPQYKIIPKVEPVDTGCAGQKDEAACAAKECKWTAAVAKTDTQAATAASCGEKPTIVKTGCAALADED